MDTTLDTAPPRCPGRRPNFPPAFKRKVVEASYQPGVSVSLIAREHDVNANMVFRWRQQYLDGVFGPVSRGQRCYPLKLLTRLLNCRHPRRYRKNPIPRSL
ncbi:transposase [Pseudomonas gessardii]|uniref:transposase n=1 Tax=Pseudomonas gessardii TaxID=78544 RepID=UPI0039F0BD49